MPITSSEIVQDDLQIDGRRYVRNMHTWSEGHTLTTAPRLVANVFDADAALLAEVPRLEVQEKEQELLRLEGLVIQGGDYVAARDSAILNTLDEVETFFAKRISNRLRTLSNFSIKRDVPVIIRFQSPLFESTPTRLAFLLGISNADANKLKSEVQALSIAVLGYSHDVPIYEDVPSLPRLP